MGTYTHSPQHQAALDERRSKVRALLIRGLRNKEIAAMLGVTERTINRDREVLGLSQFQRRLSTHDHQWINEMLNDGCSVAEIARTLGSSRHYLYSLYSGRSTYRGNPLREVSGLAQRLGLTG